MLTLFAVGLCLSAAAPVPQPVERPKAVLKFDAHRDDEFRVRVELTTASGAKYSISDDVNTNSPKAARDSLFSKMVHANWLVDATNEFGIEVYGVRDKDEKSDAIKTLTVTAPRKGKRDLATVGRVGRVSADYFDGAGRHGDNPPAAGPDLGPESYVEFDFSPVPVKKGPLDLVRKVETALENFSARDDIGAPNGSTTEFMCKHFADNMESLGFKADVVNTSKVRVYGGLFDGQFYPATRETVTSPNLKSAELPKITNPKKSQ